MDVCATAHAEEHTLENGRISIKGRCDYQVIHFLDGEYACKTISAPFKYDIDCKAIDNDSPKKYFTKINAASSKARSDGERLFLDSELEFDVFVLDECEATLLSEMIFTQSRDKHNDELLLCYPDREATLWSVAKKYGEPVSAIKKRNSISETDTAIKRRFLVI